MNDIYEKWLRISGINSLVTIYLNETSDSEIYFSENDRYRNLYHALIDHSHQGNHILGRVQYDVLGIQCVFTGEHCDEKDVSLYVASMTALDKIAVISVYRDAVQTITALTATCQKDYEDIEAVILLGR